MSRATSIVLTWSCTLWVLWGLLVFAPVVVSGQETGPQFPLPAPDYLPAPSADPVPGALPYSAPLPSPGTPMIGSCDTPDYWVVSSREAVQHRLKRREDWTLDVYHRQIGGQTVQSSLGAMTQHISPGVPVLICIHGSFVDAESNFRESAETYQWIRNAAPHLPLQVIFFSWPSDGPYTYVTPLDVAIRGERAEFNGFHVAQVVSALPASCPVSFLGHSHGCRVILSALHIAAGGSIQNLCFRYDMGAGRRYRAVLAAAAVDHNWLNPGERYDGSLRRCEALLTLINRDDIPIAVYPFHRPGAARALARVGLTERDRVRLGDQACKARELDVTSLVGSDHLWPAYFRCPRIATCIAPYVYFEESRPRQVQLESIGPPLEPLPVGSASREQTSTGPEFGDAAFR